MHTKICQIITKSARIEARIVVSRAVCSMQFPSVDRYRSSFRSCYEMVSAGDMSWSVNIEVWR